MTVRHSILSALAVLLAAASLPAAALPVIPGAAGFGTDTAAGRGGAVYRVTTLAETGAGSIGACVDATGPRICIFEVSGTIPLTRDLVIRNPRITIAGQTAPSPGILLKGAGLRIITSDVLIQHLRVRVGDSKSGPLPENRDALKIESTEGKTIRNIVIDHCSFSWSVDEMASAWMYWDNVSLLNNIFAEPLNDSLHPKGPHGFGILFGPTPGRATMVNNLLAHQVERNPLSRAGEMAFVNNVVYNRSNIDFDVQNENGVTSRTAIVGNVYLRGPEYQRTNKPVHIRTSGSLSLLSGSRLYLADNAAQEATTNAWSVASTLPSALASVKSSTTPTWPAKLVARATAGDAVLDAVLQYSGARPADRDAVDRRVVRNVRDRTGQIINCVSADGSTRCQKNAGGWPLLAKNTRRLTLPANPSTVTASGYTNLEIWLHGHAAAVEGRPAAGAPGPATLL